MIHLNIVIICANEGARDFHEFFNIYSKPVVAIGTFALGYFLSRIISGKELKQRQKDENELFQAYLLKLNK